MRSWVSIRRLGTCALALLLVVLVPAVAQAAAGGGSGGFGGGGGGGYPGGGGDGQGDWHVIMAVVVAGLMFFLLSAVGRLRYRKRRRERERRVELAAAEAAEQDETFAADRVHVEAERLFREIQTAWDRGNLSRLGELVGPDLRVEWIRRLDDFKRKGWHNHVEVLGAVQVEYVGLVNRAEDEEDRVCVRIQATLQDFVVDQTGRHIKRSDATGETKRVAEYWTLAKAARAARARGAPAWVLISIEQDKEGSHELEEPIVPSPWSDTERLHEQAVTEQAAGDKLTTGVTVAEVVDADFARDARAAALELSLVDGRFAPEVLEAEVRCAVAAWAEAVDGDDGDLRELARPEVVDELLYPSDPSHANRLVVRGPHVLGVHVTALDPMATPATMTVELEVEGRRYVENRDTTTVVSGSKDRAGRFTEHWTLALEGDDEHPWRIARPAA